MVGGGQAFDQLQPTSAVLEPKELLAVDRRPHIERAQRLSHLVKGVKTRFSAEFEFRHPSGSGPLALSADSGVPRA